MNTHEIEKEKCEVSGQYGKDNNMQFYCEFCGEEMDYREDRICLARNTAPAEEKPQEESELSRKMAHDTKEGWCCACDYDIAVLESLIQSSQREALKKVEKSISEKITTNYIEDWFRDFYDGDFILDTGDWAKLDTLREKLLADILTNFNPKGEGK